MGPIVDRSSEHLGPADKAIIGTRRQLLESVRAVEGGDDPVGVGTSYYGAVAVDRVMPAGADFRQELLADMFPVA
jgi:phthalate 4,5-dioxygenase oxygenase subunit